MFWHEIIKDIQALKNDGRALKKFGLTLGIAFGLFAAYQAWRHHAWWIYFAGIAVFFFFFAFWRPRLLGPVQKAWMGFAFVMGFGMTRFILFILFFAVVTPIGLVARCFGNRFLDTAWDKSKESYWILRPGGKIEQTRYDNQF